MSVQMTRTASAVNRRIDAFIEGNSRAMAIPTPCDCCLRFVSEDALSGRRWCALCETEFRRVLVMMPSNLRDREAA